MSEWKTLVATALVGTERGQFSTAPGSFFAVLTSQLDSGEKEIQFLSAAAIASLTRLAGQRTAITADRSGLAAPNQETVPRCGRRAAGILHSLISGQSPDLVLEWLETAASIGRRVPPELLPEILDYGAGHRILGKAISAVIGERGKWLAQMKTEWEYARGLSVPEIGALGEDPTELWETGSSEQRRLLLEEVRSNTPSVGRGLVESTWKTDSFEDRAAFLQLLRAGLGREDEPFLEQALDDKRKEVRRAAVDLLALMEGSAFQLRMRARVQPLVSMKRSILGGESLEIVLPESLDPAMRRDGIDPKPPSYKDLGERAWLMRQMLEYLPPSWWTDTFGRKPEQLIQAAAKNGEWRKLILGGMTAASVRFKAVDWQEAIVVFSLDNPKLAPEETLPVLLPDMSGIPDDRLESVMRRVLSAQREDCAQLTHALLEKRRGPWSTRLAPLVVGFVFQEMHKRQAQSQAWWNAGLLLDLAGTKCPSSILDDLEEAWGRKVDRESALGKKVSKFFDKIRNRREMRTALEEEG